METFDIYNQLTEDIAPTEAKRLIHRYLKEQVERGDGHPEERESIASAISGLMGNDVVYDHLRKDPDFTLYHEIMSYAMPLELPKEHHGGATWEELARMIHQLPDLV